MNLLRLLPALFLVLAPLFVHAGEYPFSVERIKLDGGAGILAVNDGSKFAYRGRGFLE